MLELSAQALKPLLTDGAEIAFLDVREQGQYGEGHPFFSVHLPYSRMEAQAPKLMPCVNVRCVLMDDGDGTAIRAASVLKGLGYTAVSVLAGGAPAWKHAGYNLFKGVNVPSKSFGELVEHLLGTQSITAEELHELQDTGANILVLDGRSEPEYNKMSLPHARYCPNAELGHRLAALCNDPDTLIVVNCAGRTRSIIGAQTLEILNTPNKVVALKNGTQGWRLAGFELQHNVQVTPLPLLTTNQFDAGRKKAASLIQQYSLPSVDANTAQSWLAESDTTTYLFDVRSREEYEKGHVHQARLAPGGQLVQATDEQLAVRNARIILTCDNGLRSATTAIWLKGMGHQVWVLEIGAIKSETDSPAISPDVVEQTIDLATLKKRVDSGAQILDASPGMSFRQGHIKGAQWITRARIHTAQIGDPANCVITGSDPTLLRGVVNELKTTAKKTPSGIVAGSADTWKAAGLEIETTPDYPGDEECIDYLFFVHDRHDGNLESARRYLTWELGLVDQLDDQERSVLMPLQPIS